jgi:hypothetical protein
MVLGRCDKLIAAGRPNNKRPEYQAFFNALTREEDEAAALATIATFAENEAHNSAGKPIVLSDETLALAPMWTVVADRLSRTIRQAQILLTIRNQLTAIPSYYANHGRSLMDVPQPYCGRFIAFDAWFEYAFRAGYCDYIKAIDYQALASTFLRYFPDRVNVLLYEDMVRDKSRFGQQLSNLFGVDVRALLADPTRVNPRQSNRALYYQMLRSKLMPGTRFSQLLPAGNRLQAAAERFLKGGSSIKVELADEQKKVVRDRFAAGNEWIRNRFKVDLAKHGYPL